MSRDALNAPGAAALGPYSHAVFDDHGTCYLSGQTPVDPTSGQLVDGDIGVRTTQCLQLLFSVLDAAGLGPDDVLRCNVYLTDMADFAGMNAAYAAAFRAPYPARTTVQVAGLPLGADVEIDLVARRRAVSSPPD